MLEICTGNRISMLRDTFRPVWRSPYTQASEMIQRAIRYNAGVLLVDEEDGRLNAALRYVDYGDRNHITHVGSMKKGRGAELIQSVIALGKPVTLYCAGYLIPYYERLGFLEAMNQDQRYIGHYMVRQV